jgi:uncharacterized protein (DUF1697 family)
MITSIIYIAFLRGINVGGNVLIKMDDLKKVFESLAFGNVKTVLASGNVIFESRDTNPEKIQLILEEALFNKYNHKIGVIIRTQSDLKKLASRAPFRNVIVTPNTRLYVTFLPQDAKKTALKIPYESPDKVYIISHVTSTEVLSVMTVSPSHHTTDLMNVLDHEFGKNVTTRNWNTILKLLG